MKKPTQLHDLRPMLMCDDVQKSIKFYRDLLGFEVVDRMDDVGKSGWAALKNGNARLMLASPTYSRKTDGKYPQAVYYFYPENVSALHASVVEKGWQASELSVRFYGMKEFEIIDPDGHILLFGQEPPPQKSS